MGFSAAFQKSQEPTLFSILICRVISAKSMWCGGHVWHLAVGELVWLQIMPFCMSICRFVRSSRSYPLIMVIANDWLEPPRQKSLPHDSAWVLVDILCLCIFGWPASRVEIQIFWSPVEPINIHQLSSHDAGDFHFWRSKLQSLLCWIFPDLFGKFWKKTDLEGRDLPLIFGQSLVGY